MVNGLRGYLQSFWRCPAHLRQERLIVTKANELRPEKRHDLLSEENGRRSTVAAKRCNWETRPLTIENRKPR